MHSRSQLPTHPGEILRDWMRGKQMSSADTASLLCVSPTQLNRILSGKARLSPTLAVRLEHIDWGIAESWSCTQTVWDIPQARQRLSLPAKAADTYPRRTIDLRFNTYQKDERRPKPLYRPRCASIVIACAGPQQPDVLQTRFGEIRSRNGALLRHTAQDAETVYHLWKANEPDLPDNMQVLLVDPTKSQVQNTIRNVSARIRQDYPDKVGMDFFFAGHGDRSTGGLILKDGVLSPTEFLSLQADDVGPDRGGERTIGVWLDSCYSGAFLIHLAIESFEDFHGFRVDEGLASCLPDEQIFEMDILENGVFTYTRLYPGNSHVDATRFNQAILHDDKDEIAKGLQGLVGMTSNPPAFLTEGNQFSMSLTKHVIHVQGNLATAKLGDKSDFHEVSRQLTQFKR